MRVFRRNLLIIITCAVCFSCNHQEPVRLAGEAQGTYYSIIYYDSQQRNFQPQIDSLLRDFDLSASLWVESSLINRINRGEDSLLNPVVADLLEKSLFMNDYTCGAFDCRVGPIVSALGFADKARSGQVNFDSLLVITRAQVSIDTTPSGRYIRKSNPHTTIDFNAIAQGYSVDMVAAWLSAQGVHDYLVDIGGEVIAHGTKPDGEPWSVGIERPATDKYSAPVVELAIKLQNQSVVTSGSYRKYFEQDGIRYSHTIDPLTGHPVNHTLLSVSVIDSASWRADALATAFMVMGLDSALSFIKSHPENPAAFFIYSQDSSYQTYATPAFEELIIQ